MAGVRRSVSAVGEVIEMIGDKNVSVYAAAADYFLFVSLVPILMLLVSLIHYLPFTASDLLHTLSSVLPVAAYDIVAPLVNSVYRNADTALTISIVLMVLSASKAMRPLMKGLDAIYGDDRRDTFIGFFLRSCLFMLAFVVLIIVSLAVLVYGSQIMRMLHDVLPESRLVEKLFSFTGYLRYLVMFALLTLMFVLLYTAVPAGKHRPGTQLAGALFAALMWAGFSWAFSMYVSVSNMLGAYGYIGMIMVAMMWMYFCLLFLLIGGCINAYIEKHRLPAEIPFAEEDAAGELLPDGQIN